MGSINIIKRPVDWKIIRSGNSKIVKDDIVYQMEIGSSYDYDYGQIIEFISKENYEKILDKTYKIEVYPYAIIHLLLFDENDNNICLVKGFDTDYNKLNKYQKKVLELKKNRRGN